MRRTGVFDNRATMQRERYRDSETPVETLTAIIIETLRTEGFPPFGTFPDLPPAPEET
jgi:hypothetical protein